MRLTAAEQLLQELGVTEPGGIDLEVIAFHTGARVRYRALRGCEAYIVGYGQAAIITVNTESTLPRRRFSIAHELGHWRHHRGQVLVCRVEDPQLPTLLSPERLANTFAADLLMPRYLFDPLARQGNKLTFQIVADLAATFHTSQTATAIRLIESGQFPALLVCHAMQKMKWFRRAPQVPDHWFPNSELHVDSPAFATLFGHKPSDPKPRTVKASAWFDEWDAPLYDLQEQTIQIGDEILTLLLLNDPNMLKERG